MHSECKTLNIILPPKIPQTCTENVYEPIDYNGDFTVIDSVLRQYRPSLIAASWVGYSISNVFGNVFANVFKQKIF